MVLPNFPEPLVAGSKSRRFLGCRPVEILVFATLFFTYAFFFHAGGHNAAARYDSIRSFLEHGTLCVDRYCYNSADLIKVDEHYYSSKAPGTFWLGLLPFFIASKLLYFLPEGLRYQWVCYLTNVFSNGLFSALMGMLIFRLVSEEGATPLQSLIVVVALGLGTMLLPNASLFFGHNLTAAFLFGGFYLLHYGRKLPGNVPMDRRSAFLAGYLAGFAVSIEYPGLMGAVLLLIYGFWCRRWNSASLMLLMLGVLGGVMPALVYNSLAVHKFFYITYSAYAQDPQAAFHAHSQGVLGIRLPIFDFSYWPVFLNNLKAISIGPLRGLLYLNPVLILAVAGLFLFRFSAASDRLPEHLFSLAIAIVYLVFNASYGDSIVYWGGGFSFGPRHLTPILPFLALPLLNALQNPILRLVFWPLLALSLFFCWMAVSIDPLTPYSPAYPIQEYYIPKLLRQAFSMDVAGVFSNTLVTRDSVAFNLGKILGLRGWMEFLPLLLLWGVSLCLFFRFIGKPLSNPVDADKDAVVG